MIALVSQSSSLQLHTFPRRRLCRWRRVSGACDRFPRTRPQGRARPSSSSFVISARAPRPCLADTYKGHQRGTFHKSTGRLGTWCPFGSHSSVLLGPCPRFRRRNDITQQPTEVKVWNMSYPESSAQTPLACWKLYELYVSSSVSVACGTPSFIRLKRQDVCWHWQLTQHVQQH